MSDNAGERADLAGTSRRGRKTIMVVDDDPDILIITSLILRKLGYIVLTANSPHEAVRLAREPSGKIDLLLTDVVMPEMHGQDLAKQLQNLLPNLRLAFMSGSNPDSIALIGVQYEDSNFIPKPFSPGQLADRIRNIFEDDCVK